MSRKRQGAAKQPSRVPTFSSREEEAAWWDTHDLADYQDEFETVEARFAEKLSDQDVSPATRSSGT